MLSQEDKIDRIFEIFEYKNKAPRTELEYKNGYTLLCAVLLSAQATDIGVNKATKKLFSVADTPQKMVDLNLETVTGYIKTIGLYRNKAKNLLLMSQKLLDDFNGKIPNNREDLMSLAGVGRKTANVVLNELYQMPTIAVDTHIFRVSNRTGIAIGKNVDSVETILLKVIPDQYKLHAHHHLILHGRYICKARKPLCSQCPIYAYCNYSAKEV